VEKMRKGKKGKRKGKKKRKHRKKENKLFIFKKLFFVSPIFKYR
jgi:hypothetical protein